MPKRLTSFPKALHVGRSVRLAGKLWTVRDAYSQRDYGSDKNTPDSAVGPHRISGEQKSEQPRFPEAAHCDDYCHSAEALQTRAGSEPIQSGYRTPPHVTPQTPPG
jgi:hypothetical protein